MTGTTADTRSVTVEREFAHPPEKLWRALTEPHLVAEWLMRNDFAPVPGHHFTFSGDWGGTIACEVLTVDPPHTLAYSWHYASADPALDLASIVTFTLTPTETGTRLRVEQSGFRPGQTQAYSGAGAGWRRFLGRLDDLLPRLETP